MTLEGNRVQSPSFVQFYNLSKVWQSMSHAEHLTDLAVSYAC